MNNLFSSTLHDEKTFYQTFLQDLEHCENEVIIESPFITCERMRTFDRIFQKLLQKRVKIYVITRDPKEHDEFMQQQSAIEIQRFEELGIQPLLCVGNDHRKLAILDRKVLWEGSLNILSQTYSREIMRRMESQALASQMFDFLKLKRVL